MAPDTHLYSQANTLTHTKQKGFCPRGQTRNPRNSRSNMPLKLVASSQPASTGGNDSPFAAPREKSSGKCLLTERCAWQVLEENLRVKPGKFTQDSHEKGSEWNLGQNKHGWIMGRLGGNKMADSQLYHRREWQPKNQQLSANTSRLGAPKA